MDSKRTTRDASIFKEIIKRGINGGGKMKLSKLLFLILAIIVNATNIFLYLKCLDTLKRIDSTTVNFLFIIFAFIGSFIVINLYIILSYYRIKKIESEMNGK